MWGGGGGGSSVGTESGRCGFPGNKQLVEGGTCQFCGSILEHEGRRGRRREGGNIRDVTVST